MSLRDKLAAVAAPAHTDTQPDAQEASATFLDQQPLPQQQGQGPKKSLADRLLTALGIARQDTYVPSTHRAALPDSILADMPPPGTLARKLWARECLTDEQRRELADLQRRGLIR